ncbi:MAG: Eco57I restriction-modification methylase domain-containing protein [Fibrobacter sp.]|nr:Eco57I restriction-modification methylase domain-containing protein [Fibrobacter sp.]
MVREKQQFGQYMTPKIIVDFMVGLIEHGKKSKVLEPSCGEGAFLDGLHAKGFKNVSAYEIDKDILKNRVGVNNSSFVLAPLNETFDVVIGNPPYIRWKNLEEPLKEELSHCDLWNRYCNSLCDYSNIFIIKSIEQLNDGGELIFITPEYWISTTHANSLRNYMLQNGYVKQIYHFNETPIFEKANVSLIIFHYIKSKKKLKTVSITKFFSKKKMTQVDIENIKSKNSENVECFEVPQFKENSRWLLVDEKSISDIENFEKACKKKNRIQESLFDEKDEYEMLGDFCEIGNGMVSGLDKAFQLTDDDFLNEKEKKNVIKVVKAKNITSFVSEKSTNYIFVNEPISSESDFSEKFPNFSKHLVPFKVNLKKRYDYGRKLNYWEWAFLRNYNLFASSQEKIFVPCKERITHKDRFRFSLANNDLFPTQDVTAIYKRKTTQESVYYILALLNSYYVFNWLKSKGVRKGDIVEFSEKPISIIPFRKIDFSNENEVKLHNQIVVLVKNFIRSKENTIIKKIDECIDQLMR